MKKCGFGWYVIVAALVLSQSLAAAKTIYVSRSATGKEDGSSWVDAHTTFQAAIAAAVSGDEVWVAAGIYRPNDENPEDLTRSQSFQMKDGVAIYGGFSGIESSLAWRNVAANLTIFCADLKGDDIYRSSSGSVRNMSDNAYHVFYHPNTLSLGPGTVLDSVTIRSGNANGGGWTSYGGGFHHAGPGALTISNCTFRNNAASYGGGALYNEAASLILSGSAFVSNSAPTGGAAFTFSPLIAQNCTFADNLSTGYSFSSGGTALYNTNASTVVTNCTFRDQTTSSWTAYSSSSEAQLKNCIFWGRSQNSIRGFQASHCIVQGHSGIVNASVNPQLLPLGQYGSPTPVMPLPESSPARNAGVAGDGVPATDQRGQPRDSQPDIGACEYQAQGYVSAVYFREGHQPCAVGSSPVLEVYHEGLGSPTFQWFEGLTGDDATPLKSATAPALPVPPLDGPTSFWVRVGTLEALAASIQTVMPNVIHVSPSGDDANDGSSWSFPKRTLQGALAAAPSSSAYLGSQVWLGAGTYKPNDPDPANLSQDQAFQLTHGIAVFGGFGGTETSAGQRDAFANPSILSGDLLGNDADLDGDGRSDAPTVTDNAVHVIYLPPSALLEASVRLDSVTIRGGNSPSSAGGGLTAYGGTLAVTNCLFTDNRARSGGAAHVSAFSSFGDGVSTFTDCAFVNNTATDFGSAVYCSGSGSQKTTLNNCTFFGNTARIGGALFISSSSSNAISLALNHCTFVSNSCPLSYTGNPRGSVILSSLSFLNSDAITLTNCIIWGNSGSEPIVGTGIVATNSIIEGGFPGTNILTEDPLLMPLGNYGGQTPTMPPSMFSPAINVGLGGQLPIMDQRHLPRDLQPDLGACELSPEPSTVLVGTLEKSTVFAADFQPTLQAFPDGRAESFQWFKGASGDESTPVASGATPILTLPPLSTGGSYWVKASFPGGAINSNAISLSAATPVVYLSTAGNDANDGTSWTAAKRSLPAAIDATGYGGQVWAAAGIYRPNDANPADLDRTQSFSLRSGVRILGGFAGSEASVAERDRSGNEVVFSGDLAGNDRDADGDGRSEAESTAENAYHVFFNGAPVSAATQIDSVTIRGGNANGSDSHSAGGGIHTAAYFLGTVVNSTFTDNSASYGGAVFTHFSSPVLMNCTFAGNSALNGGAIHSHTSRPVVTHCTITDNSAGSSGGAIYCLGGFEAVFPLTLRNSLIWGNAGSTPVGWNVNASHSLIQGGYAGTEILTSDPLLLPFGDHRGHTPTSPVAPSSPAINAGLNSVAFPSSDQRGFLRDVRPDIGACEHPVYVASSLATPQATIGDNVTLSSSTGLPMPAFQWYRGLVGDTSDPIGGAMGSTYITPPLDVGDDYWVAITSEGATYQSPTSSIHVRGTYQQWTEFHELTGSEADPDAVLAGDGLSNLIKFAAGLAPRDPAPQSAFFSANRSEGGGMTLQLTLSLTPTNVSWVLRESSDLSRWSVSTATPTVTASSTAHEWWSVEVPMEGSARFFETQFELRPE